MRHMLMVQSRPGRLHPGRITSGAPGLGINQEPMMA
jgi:hypothetical protein